MALKKARDPEDFEKGKYGTILADGLIHIAAADDDDGEDIVIRKYEVDGVEHEKRERQYEAVSGMITKIAFKEGNYGNNIHVYVLDDGDEEPIILSMSTTQNFGEDMMKKLPAIDLKKKVEISPYSFMNDRNKPQKGVSIVQDGKKIKDFYTDATTKAKLHGFPEMTKKKPTNTDWKAYFLNASIFLTEDISERFNIEVPEEEPLAKEFKKK